MPSGGGEVGMVLVQVQVSPPMDTSGSTSRAASIGETTRTMHMRSVEPSLSTISPTAVPVVNSGFRRSTNARPDAIRAQDDQLKHAEEIPAVRLTAPAAAGAAERGGKSAASTPS